MVQSANKFHKKMLKTLTEVDWMVCSIAFTVNHQNVSEKSELGKTVNKMLEQYQTYLQTQSLASKERLEKYLKIFFPSKFKSKSFKPFSLKSVKIYGGNGESPQGATQIQKQKYKEQREQLIPTEQDKEKLTNDMLKIVEETQKVVLQTVSETNEMMKSSLGNEAQKQDAQTLRDKDVENSFGKVFSGIKDIKEAVHELTNIASGNLTYQQIFSTTIVWLLKKLLWGVAKLSFTLVKMIFVDTWWVPVKMAGTWIVKKFGKPFVIILGCILIVQISGIIYMGSMLCTDPDYVKDNISVCNNLSENIFFNMAHEIGYVANEIIWKDDKFVYSSDLGLKLSFNDWTNMSLPDFEGKSAKDIIYHFLSYTGVAYNWSKGNEAVKAIAKHTGRSFIMFLWYDLGLHDLFLGVLKEGSKNAVGAVFGETVQNLLY